MTSDIQTGQTGNIRSTFKLHFPRHLCRATFVILAMFLFCEGGSNPLSQVVWSSVSKSLTSLLKNLGRRKSGERERPRGLNCPNISWKLQNLIKISPVQSFACRMLPKEKHQSELNRPSFLGPFPKLAFPPTGGLSKWPSLSLYCVCVSAPAASKDEKQISEGQRGCYIVPVFTTNTGCSFY